MYHKISDPTQRRIEEKLGRLQERLALEAVHKVMEFDRTPADLKADLDRFVIGQEMGKKVLATAISFHYRRLGQALKQAVMENGQDIDLALRKTANPKANILILGPTGCGKTYTAEIASELVGVPFVKVDLTKFSEVGYVGQNVSDILADLLIYANGNAQIAQMGMVYLDEIDKIASEPATTRDVSGRGVQKGLLKLVEGMENTIELGRERIHLTTKHVLFIGGGSFEKLEGVVKKRLTRLMLPGDWQARIHTDDFVACGMDKQLMGRFPVRVAYDGLSAQDLKDIMTRSEGSPLISYVQDFKAWDIDLEFTDEALEEVARRAREEEIGARGLVAILHRLLLEDMYQRPGTFTGRLRVDQDYVEERLP